LVRWVRCRPDLPRPLGICAKVRAKGRAVRTRQGTPASQERAIQDTRCGTASRTLRLLQPALTTASKGRTRTATLRPSPSAPTTARSARTPTAANQPARSWGTARRPSLSLRSAPRIREVAAMHTMIAADAVPARTSATDPAPQPRLRASPSQPARTRARKAVGPTATIPNPPASGTKDTIASPRRTPAA
jgi:hypothetical protein